MTLNDTISGSLLNEKQVAKHLNVSLASLRRWRVEGRGPRFRKLGECVRYSVADLDRWLDSLPAGGAPVAEESAA